MRKIILIMMVFAFAALVVTPVSAKNPKSPADYNGLDKGNSETYHLYLYEKANFYDCAELEEGIDCWNIKTDGAWGKMTYKGKKFVFNGHDLEMETEYSLIHYMEDWPSIDELASGMSDMYGDIHLSGMHEFGSGEKYWLVPTSDLNGDQDEMDAWNPASYLFEYAVTP